MKIIKILSAVFLLCILLCSCKNTAFNETTFFALDTVITLKTESSQSAEKIKSLVSEYEKVCSPTDENGELCLLNSNKKTTVSEKFEKVFGEALKISEKTDGAYNFSVYPLMMKWGFLSREYTVPASEEILQILPHTDLSEIKIENGELIKSENAMIDFGGIAKGVICDEAVKIIKESGEKNALLSFGGNVYAIGNKKGKKWEVGIRNPFSDGFAGILKAEDVAVVTSGAYERFFEQDGKVYHHILNPETGYPAEGDLASVTIVSENCALADGYSTALFVMGFEKAKEFYKAERNFDAVFILKSGEIHITEGIEKDFSGEKFEIIY